MIERTTTFDQNEEPTIAFYTTSHLPAPGCARRFAELARGHWGGSESRNHWVRDACMREDKTRSKNYNLNCNLSALRVCLVALKAAPSPRAFLAGPAGALPARPPYPFPSTPQAPLQMKRL